MGSPAATLAIWLVGGFLALTGALCYAELATAYPRQGGDYVYLSRAYGRPWGWLFGSYTVLRWGWMRISGSPVCKAPASAVCSRWFPTGDGHDLAG